MASPAPETVDDYLGTYEVLESRRHGEVGSPARVPCADVGPIAAGPAFLKIAPDELNPRLYAVYQCGTPESCEFLSFFEIPKLDSRVAFGVASGNECILQAEQTLSRVEDGVLSWQRLRWSSQTDVTYSEDCTGLAAELLIGTSSCEQVTTLAARRVE